MRTPHSRHLLSDACIRIVRNCSFFDHLSFNEYCQTVARNICEIDTCMVLPMLPIEFTNHACQSYKNGLLKDDLLGTIQNIYDNIFKQKLTD